MKNDNSNPSESLVSLNANEAGTRRGKLKIFFGYAAGVGKTYAMLDAARMHKAEGVDVVIGYIDSHGRVETEALLDGMEILPRRDSTDQDLTQHEFDLDAALARHPALILVDDLAHTNASGSAHAKRWQDVQELLEAGINVYTSLNVQHLESLNDLITQITGVVIRETIPDTVFEQADEVELIDLAPDDLLQRFKEDKVYVPEDASYAVPHFFRKGNLIALRELAMRCAADRVDTQMQDYRHDHAVSRPWLATERILVCISQAPDSARLVRAAHRMAKALHAEWFAVHIEAPESLRLAKDNRDYVAQTLHLADQLGAETTTLSGNNVSEELIAFAHSHNVSRIVVGKSSHPRWRQALFGSIAGELVQKIGRIEVHVITGDREEAERSTNWTFDSINWLGYFWAVIAIAFCTFLSKLIAPYFSLTDIVILYLLGIVIVAAWQGLGPSILASAFSVLAFDFFFVPPTSSFTFYDQHFVVTFGFMLLLGIMISTLTAQIRHQARAARQREQHTAALYALSRDLARMWSKQELIEMAIRHIGQVMECQAAILLPDPPERMSSPDPSFQLTVNERAIAEWVYEHGQAAGWGTETLADDKILYLPLVASRRTIGVLGMRPRQISSPLISPEQFHLLETLASQTALAIERAYLVEESQKAKVQIETERMRNALLSSVSHDLKTPLAAIAGAAGSLIEDEVGPRRELILTITEEADRLNRLISDLLDMTRLESGALQVRKEWQAAEGIVGATFTRLGARLRDHPVTTHIPADMPLVLLDSVLIGQVLMNLLENAIKYTPSDSPIDVSVNISGGQVLFQVADRGSGIRSGDEERVFDKFYRARTDGGGVGLGLTVCRGIIAAHSGRIWAKNREGGGAVFQFTLPIEGEPPEVKAEETEWSEKSEGIPMEEAHNAKP